MDDDAEASEITPLHALQPHEAEEESVGCGIEGDEEDSENAPLRPSSAVEAESAIISAAERSDSDSSAVWTSAALWLAAIGLLCLLGFRAVRSVPPQWQRATLDFIHSSPFSSTPPPSPSFTDYWPAMVTTVRQCPAYPTRTVRLSRGSRWLTSPADTIAHYAFTVDHHGRRRAALLQHGDETSILRQGTGFGVAEWEPTWSRSEAQQQQASDVEVTETDERINELMRSMPIKSQPNVSRSHHAFDRAPQHPHDSSEEEEAAVVDTWLDQVTAFDEQLEIGQYTRASDKTTVWEVTTAPWFEMRLPGPLHQQKRVLMYGSEAILPDYSSVNATTAHISTLLIVLNANDFEPPSEEMFITNNVTLFHSFTQNLTCSFVIQFDEDAVSRRQARGETVNTTHYRQQLDAFHERQQQPQSAQVAVDADVLQLLCPLPSALLGPALLLDQHVDGPILALRAVQYHLPAVLHPVWGFSSFSLPLCLVRTRRSHSALLLGQAMYGPPSRLTPELMHESLHYYLFMGVQQLYVADRFGSMYASLLPYLNAGLMDYIRVPFLQPSFKLAYTDQHYVVWLLQQFARLANDWVIQLDPDEFFTPLHPYFTDNNHTLQAADASCHDSTAAWKARENNRDRFTNLSNLPHTAADLRLPQYCPSLLTTWLSLASEYDVMHVMIESVMMGGIGKTALAALSTEESHRNAMYFHWSIEMEGKWGPSGDTPSLKQWGEFDRRVLLSRLVWRELTAADETALDVGLLSIFPHRALKPDNRVKMVYTPRFATGMSQHHVHYPADVRGQQLLSIGNYRQHMFPELGARQYRRSTIDNVEMRADNISRRVDLVQLYCQPLFTSAEVEQCCQMTGYAAHSCLLSDLSSRHQQWELATRTPHFPLLSQLNQSTHSDLPASYQLFPLSLAARVSHLFCVSRQQRMMQLCKTYKIADGEESSEDEPLARIRTAFYQWRPQQTQWLKRDQRLYWSKQRDADNDNG